MVAFGFQAEETIRCLWRVIQHLYISLRNACSFQIQKIENPHVAVDWDDSLRMVEWPSNHTRIAYHRATARDSMRIEDERNCMSIAIEVREQAINYYLISHSERDHYLSTHTRLIGDDECQDRAKAQICIYHYAQERRHKIDITTPFLNREFALFRPVKMDHE